MQVNRKAKDVDHVGGLGSGEGTGGQKQPGVVIDHVEDLGALPTRKLPVSDVGLPHLVGQLGFEAHQRGARALLRLGTTRPSRRKIRQIVETEGTESSSLARW